MRETAGEPDDGSLSEPLADGASRFFDVLHWIVLTAAVRFVADKAHSVAIVLLSNLAVVMIFLGVLGLALGTAERVLPGNRLTPPDSPKALAYAVLSSVAAVAIALLVWLLINPTIDALAAEAPR